MNNSACLTCTSCRLLQALPDTNFVQAFAELYTSYPPPIFLYPSRFAWPFLQLFFFSPLSPIFSLLASALSANYHAYFCASGALKHRSHRIITHVSSILLLLSRFSLVRPPSSCYRDFTRHPSSSSSSSSSSSCPYLPRLPLFFFLFSFFLRYSLQASQLHVSLTTPAPP